MYRKTLVAGTVLALFAGVSLAQSFDVVVVGSGGAGLSAASMAKEAGSSVVVLEKMPYLGGNSNFASGGMNAACTKQQIAGGVTNDSPEIFYQDTMKGGHWKNDPELVRTLVSGAAGSVEWLLALGGDLRDVGSASARDAAAASPWRVATVPATAPPSGLKFFAF